MIKFTLYSRTYCHLCDDMLDALNAMQDEATRFEVDVVDVDADEALVARFDELVPVLYGDLSQPELCHYFLDADAVRAYVASVQAKGNPADDASLFRPTDMQ
ncbi:glutaredoxin family protein [Massilia sp. GCM10020059]|uniref:Glutaredoxin family protein n=1 Tax=Massilia agrisoli TaxID=2892444 RepID=A0ABS8IU31_9BURK|nr:glutaredoxin family protein [Massilia agrisoli]MCC6071925.1 glutaredoxin family protein [Massilia agrisoli]